LIVCEGEKTEPLYLDDIRRQNRISTAHITITHGGVTEPRQIVDYAETEFLKTRDYEHVFAVFDRDQHLTWTSALDRAEQLDGTLVSSENEAVSFKAIPTVPSFELWLVMHYEDMFGLQHRASVLRRAQHYIAGYTKGSAGIYARIEDRLDAATRRASQLRRQFTARPANAPYTDMDFLVAMLRSVRRP
jgi:hypothetical protein